MTTALCYLEQSDMLADVVKPADELVAPIRTSNWLLSHAHCLLFAEPLVHQMKLLVW